ncbi:fumarylacetoacetate hydrolase family protein, partial [Mycobacterium tuberculosis]|uniref:fumarylacetoacetate hydrolase family protein n=1 Tax=Mycobacterium tuberculosis TaxID=1773 RepID=UPI001EEEFB06
MGGRPPAAPVLFLPPPPALLGPPPPLRLPAPASPVPFAGALALVLGRACQAVPAAPAVDHILGSPLGTAVSARAPPPSAGPRCAGGAGPSASRGGSP